MMHRHDWGKWQVLVYLHNQEPFLQYRTCSKCGKVKKKGIW